MVLVHSKASTAVAHILVSYSDLRLKGITLSKCQLWRNERDGKFPQRVQMSAARVAWVESEIDAWIAERIADRVTPPEKKPAAPHDPHIVSGPIVLGMM